MPDNQYRVTVIPAQGTIPPANYPAYLYVFGLTVADAVSEARAVLRLQGYEPRLFELRVERRGKVD